MLFSQLKTTLFAAWFTFILAISDEVTVPKCLHPAVRKEWRALTRPERADWIRAVKCLAQLPHSDSLAPSVNAKDTPVNASGSYFDDIVYIHMDLDERIHFTGLFLPWHRWYVHAFESALKTKCGFQGTSPYWDWTQDAPDFHEASIFQDSNPESGLGGWGDASADFRVQDGAFSPSSPFKLSYPSTHTVRRNFTLRPYLNSAQPEFIKDQALLANETFSKAEMEKLVSGFPDDYKGFQVYLEGFQGAHSGVHLITGGDLSSACPENAPIDCIGGSKWSSNEPLFWMHHAMIDRIWFNWQQKHTNARLFEGGSVQRTESITAYKAYPNGGPPFLSLDSIMPGDGLLPEVKISDVLDTTGDYLCYTYDA